MKNHIAKYRGIYVMIGLLLANTAHAFDMGNMMNPSKWMGSNKDDDYDRRGYGYGGPGWGYPGYGYGWGGYPGYGGWGGYPGYGWGYPAYTAPVAPTAPGYTSGSWSSWEAARLRNRAI